MARKYLVDGDLITPDCWWHSPSTGANKPAGVSAGQKYDSDWHPSMWIETEEKATDEVDGIELLREDLAKALEDIRELKRAVEGLNRYVRCGGND